MTEGQCLKIFTVDKPTLVALKEDTFAEVKGFKEIRMKTNDFPIETISKMRKQDKRSQRNLVAPNEDTFPEVNENKEIRMRKKDKRSPIQPTSTTPMKRVIFGRKNQLIRMMKKRGRGGNNPKKNLYIRVN